MTFQASTTTWVGAGAAALILVGFVALGEWDRKLRWMVQNRNRVSAKPVRLRLRVKSNRDERKA